MIWLRYANNGVAVALQFRALASYPLDEVTLDAGKTLAQVRYAHRLSAGLSFQLSIGADELYLTANHTFLREFWKAQERWYSEAPGATEPAVAAEATTGLAGDYLTQFVSVVIDGGPMPVEWVEGSKLLPSWLFTVSLRYPTA